MRGLNPATRSLLGAKLRRVYLSARQVPRKHNTGGEKVKLYGATASEKSVLVELARLRSEGVSYSKCAAYLNGRQMFNSDGNAWTESAITQTCRIHIDADRIIHHTYTADARVRLGLHLLAKVAEGTGEKAAEAKMALHVYTDGIEAGLAPKDSADLVKVCLQEHRAKRREQGGPKWIRSLTSTAIRLPSDA